MEKKFSYSATGYVLGNMWGGGTSAYPTIEITGETAEIVLEKANKALADESLDSGFGFESLIGACLVMVVTKTIVFEDEEYKRTDDEVTFIGDLSNDDKEFLLTLTYLNL